VVSHKDPPFFVVVFLFQIQNLTPAHGVENVGFGAAVILFLIPDWQDMVGQGRTFARGELGFNLVKGGQP
jgi:hypothetical protein